MVWCVSGRRGIFLAPFGPLSTNRASFKYHKLPEYCCWRCSSLHVQNVPIFHHCCCGCFHCNIAPNEKSLIILDCFFEISMRTSSLTSNDLHSHQISSREPLGCVAGLAQSTNMKQYFAMIVSKEYSQHIVEEWHNILLLQFIAYGATILWFCEPSYWARKEMVVTGLCLCKQSERHPIRRKIWSLRGTLKNQGLKQKIN